MGDILGYKTALKYRQEQVKDKPTQGRFNDHVMSAKQKANHDMQQPKRTRQNEMASNIFG